MIGDSIVLTSQVYDLSKYQYVLLRFNHICKISPQDITRIEYRISGRSWQVIPATSYLEKTKINQSGMYEFNANMYSEWQANDSLAIPEQSWWKEEIFDVSFEVGGDDEVQFRFFLKHGNTPGTQISYGWLIDNIEIIAATYEMKVPVVEFIAPFIPDTVYSTGIHTIHAKVKSQTPAPIEHPWLIYTATNAQETITDTLLMTHVSGDSLWEAIMPRFISGTEVIYFITGKDTTGNAASSITAGYVIIKPNHHYGDISVALTSIDSPIWGSMGGVTTPVTVTIHNKGDSALTSATIYRSINGVITSYPWTGNLAWDFEQQLSLGTYQSRMEEYDTIVIWVSMPNGIADIVLTDDTLSVITFGCSAGISGTYTVGQDGVFPDLKEALTVLSYCSISGNITLALKSGVYPGNIDLSNSVYFMGNYTLTITSLANHKDSVILRPTFGVGITLANSNNVVLKELTVDATSGTFAVEFTAACTNVVIRDCKLLANPTATTTTHVVINKESSTGIADSIFIINNLLDGGYYGIYLYGGTGIGHYGTNIILDSNMLTNQYYFGIVSYCNNLTSCSYNTILSRTENTYTRWLGLNLPYNNGTTVIGNRIIQRSNAITASCGISVTSFNYHHSLDTVLIANNEIILHMTSTMWAGINVTYDSRAKILHNSIYISGSEATQGIGIRYNYDDNYVEIKNNNIVMESTNAYPIYLNSTENPASYDMDYNNMYAPTYVGYFGSAKTSLAEWQQTVTTDLHSISVRPSFVDSSVHLKVTDYLPLYVSTLSEVDVDIENTYRTGFLTAMGCYHGITLYAVNAAVGNISGFRTGGIFGQQDSIKVELVNTGTTTLTTAVLNWSINGITQSAIGITWSGALLPEQHTVVTLGAINYTQTGNNIIRVWIDNLGGLQDEDFKDDTVTISGYICLNTFSGSYTIGSGGTFPSWDAAMEQAKLCGVNGDVLFEFLPGSYSENIDLTNISSLFGANMLTITSTTRNAADVTLQTTSYGILLNNSNHITIEAVTIDATAGTYAIQFTGKADDIAINNCIILANLTTASNTYAGIYKATNTGDLANVRITNCKIRGGYYGIYLEAQSDNYYQNITIDSNIISEQYYHAAYLYYTDLNSVSYNQITPRSSNQGGEWYGLYFHYARNGNIIGNRIWSNNSGIITTLYGLYAYHPDSALVANNEIYLNSSAYQTYGMYLYYSNGVDYLHNTVLLTGTGGPIFRAADIYISTSTLYNATYKNNIFIANGGEMPYAIYLSAIGATFAQYNHIDYNNYYSSGDLGYAGTAQKDLAAWKSIVNTDSNSVSKLPWFINVANSLELLDYTLLSCNLIPAVGSDIRNSNRNMLTAMGCYEEPLKNTNGALVEISGLREGTIAAGETDSIKVIFINEGSNILNTVNVGWSINGTIQPPKDFLFNTPLAKTQIDTIDFGILTYLSGNYEIKVWINHFEGGTLLDEYLLNDTVSASVFVCTDALTGVIPVSDASSFSTITAAIQAVLVCGRGDITLLLDSGVYEENCDFSDINRYKKGNTLTLTSKTGKADDVIIRPSSGAGITLANTYNLTLKAITVDVKANTRPALQFTNACTNIVVKDCKFLADTTTTTTAAVISKELGGVVDSVFFIHNLIDGGSIGVNFYGGSSLTVFGTNVVFDSNTISNQYTTSASLITVNIISCSHNTILSRTTNTGSSWTAINSLYLNGGPILGNRIIQRDVNITSPVGISLNGYNYRTTSTSRGLVANNEIILNINASGTYSGIYANSSRAEIIHNSIYISGTGAARGIQIQNSANNDIVIKNNNIVLTSSLAYPVYFSAIGNLQLYDMDYNNLYAPSYLGYYGGDITTMATWQQTILTDQHSVHLYPNFIDSSASLELLDYSGLVCPSVQGAGNDINGVVRSSTTVMGAYHGAGSSFDLSMQQVLCKDTSVSYPQPIPVKIEIAIIGSGININNAIFGWSINGILQPSYTWVASNPLIPGTDMEVSIGSFNSVERTNIFDIVVWIESVNGAKDSVDWNDTAKTSIQVLWTGSNLNLQSMEQLVPEGALCSEDYVPLIVQVKNTGTVDYDFAANPVTFSARVTNPEPFSLDTVVSTGEIKSGEISALELTDMFPIIVAGIYDIEAFMNSPVDNIKFDDTIRNDYISGRLGLPIDENFSSSIPIEFNLNSNTLSQWQIIPQGTGADTVVFPQFGIGMLAFSGSRGAMTTLSTRQMDLSQTIQPALSFWYFHDTIPYEDYTDVRITVDGGTTYNTLFSLTKYNPVYGWQQYNMDLPSYAVNQCVILVFEAMEKSRSEDVTQYIDRILITARQDIAISEIITSELTVCDLENKEVKVVLSNLTDPVLDFVTTPTTVTLEIMEMGQIFTHVLDSGSLGRFASDTITIVTGINFTKGTYTLKAYFLSVLDVDRMNDTLVTSIAINPALSVSVYPESSPANCLTRELVVNPTITLYNTGNMDLSNIDMILQVDTGENNTDVYALLKETYTGSILAGDSATYMFNSSYSVPWNARYNVRATIYLGCDSVLAHSTIMITECVDIKDLYIVSIDNPSGVNDAVGSSIQVTTTLNNRSDGDVFTDIPINVRITNSQGIEQETFMEPQTIGASATVSHTFSRSYTVPNDSVYYLTVFVNSQDNYRDNDTMTIRRETESVGIETLKSIGGVTLYQNIPNPANNRTRIDYSIPENGEVVFNLHSVSGQLLYSQTIEAANGKQSIELNTSSFSVGIYFYSIEYKGQRLVKRMMNSE
jgi:hypothetical protein